MPASKFWATTTLIIALVSCAKKECEELPFTTDLSDATILAETSLIDFGVPEHRGALHEGWSFDERWSDQSTFVWGVGNKSTVAFRRFGTGAAQLRFRCATAALPGAPEQRIRPRINGVDLPDVLLRKGTSLAVYQLDVPAAALRQGANTIEWQYSAWGAPANSDDARPLAVAWDWIELVERGVTPKNQPVRVENGSLFLPVRTGIELDLPARPGSFVVIDRVEAVGSKESMADAFVAFELTVNGDTASAPTRFEMQTGLENVRVPIAIDRPGTIHVRMFAPASRRADGSGWRVIHPRLVQTCL